MNKLGKFEMDKVYCGDCRDLIKDLPDNSIDMCITSPPYWGLRDYGEETKIIWDGNENCKHKWNSYIKKQHSGRIDQINSKDTVYSHHQNIPDKKVELAFCQLCGAWKGQLGLEPDFNLYIKHLCDIFDEVKRVLKKEGTCWVNIGDTYGGSGSASGHTEYTKNLGYITSKMGATKGHTKSLMPKCLIMIPFRFAIEMVNRGWILRNTIIWHKPNCMPSSAKDRFTIDFEYLFFFSKNKKYYFEQQFEKYTEPLNRWGGPMIRKSSHKYIEVGEPRLGKFGATSMFRKGRLVRPDNKGRNKRTVWKIGSKYIKTEGHSSRAGLQREPTLREKRINEIIQKEIANYLRKYLTNEKRKILDKVFGKHRWPHWIRTDKSGASLPSPNDWIKLKEILGFDNKYDDIMTETEIYLDDGMMWKNKGKNKRTVWSITTKGFKEAHFAVFPEKLIEIPIKAGCPEFVCKKCGKAREKIYKIIKHQLIEDYKGKAHKDYASAKAQNPSDTKRRILESMTKEQKEVGHVNCGCNAGFDCGIVLDPFIGSGTTGVVAIKQRKHFIGFEINPDYVKKIANKRLENIQVKLL